MVFLKDVSSTISLLLAVSSVYIGKQSSKVNVDYKPPEDGLERAETYVGVEE
jgi:hypothetical protein